MPRIHTTKTNRFKFAKINILVKLTSDTPCTFENKVETVERTVNYFNAGAVHNRIDRCVTDVRSLVVRYSAAMRTGIPKVLSYSFLYH